MRKLIIIGNSMAGLMAADAYESTGGEVLGFYSDRSCNTLPWPWLGKTEDAVLNPEDAVFLAVEDRDLKQRMCEKYKEYLCPGIIHQNAYLSPHAVVENGVLISAGTIVGPGCCIEHGTIIEESCRIGAESRIGKNCYIKAGTIIGNDVSVDDGTFIGAGAVLKDHVTIAANKVIQTGEIVVKDMVMKMVYKRGAWIYRENGPEDR